MLPLTNIVGQFSEMSSAGLNLPLRRSAMTIEYGDDDGSGLANARGATANDVNLLRESHDALP